MAGRDPRRAPGEHISLPSNAAADVDAYFEYRAYEKQPVFLLHVVFVGFFFVFADRIVGDDDGGKLFTPEEYEQYKKQVLPMVRIVRVVLCSFRKLVLISKSKLARRVFRTMNLVSSKGMLKYLYVQ